MKDVKFVVAKNIKRYREAIKMTQHELAVKLEVGDSVISNWEMGTNSPNIVKLFMMCQIFGVTPSTMFDLETEESRQHAYQQSPADTQQAIDTLIKEKEQ